MIVGLIGYDSIRKHLAACGYYTAEIREKYYLRIADAYIDIKEQRGQYWLENIMKDRFAVSMFGQKRLSREGGIEIVVKELCTRMARDGCQVTCYNRSGHHVSGAEYDNKIEYDGIRQKFVPTIERKGLAAVSSSFFAALYSAFVQKAGGLMTAKKAGTTTMRCKMPNGTQATCNVTVKPLATSLKLNASEIVLYIGQSFDINSSVPKGTAAYYRLYSSSNSKIAAVTRGGGVVKGVATGKATVTCTLNNGKKAICNVYIMPQSKKISNVPLIGQSKLPTGCETCSATMLLNFYGYKISETTFADKYLVKKPFGYSNGSYTGPDPNCAFVGTPYSSNSYGAYAPIMVKCMNKYLSDKSYKAVEISGKSLEYLSGKYVAQGQPIMVWATINMSPSFKTTTWRVNYTDENAKYKLGSYYTWTAGEHCLLLTGYDKDYYYFNDPWTNARTRYSKSLVNTRYNELGKQAVVMVKK